MLVMPARAAEKNASLTLGYARRKSDCRMGAPDYSCKASSEEGSPAVGEGQPKTCSGFKPGGL